MRKTFSSIIESLPARRGSFKNIFSTGSVEHKRSDFPADLPINPLAIINKYYDQQSALYRVLVVHSILVAAKALELAEQYLKNHSKAKVDLRFIEEASLLHDIGIFQCNAPEILCFGSEPYIRHGMIGKRILEEEGWPRHALVCERHTGVGLTREDVINQNLPLPARDFMPVSVEEKIICLADKFFSKKPKKLFKEKSLSKIEKGLKKRGVHIARRFRELHEEITG